MATSPYQQRTASLTKVAGSIDVGDPDRVSRIILSVSPCRSGTTILLRVFGAAGVESHFQQLKNILRWQLQGRDVQWQIPQRPGDTVYLKETLGPYTDAEAQFNPLDVLLSAGLPREKLHIVIVGRAPLSTWASWYEWWGSVTSVEKFILAYDTTERIRQQGHDERIPVTTCVYEAIRDNGPETVVKNLFQRLDVPYTAIAVGGWDRLPRFGAPGSNIVLPEEPPIFITPNIHRQVQRSNRLAYRARNGSIAGLKEQDVCQIMEAGLPAIYETWRTACEETLHVSVEQDRV